jgi:arylsulfatase A-like enzyme
MMGDHGFPTKGAWHYDGCIRVPLIIHAPNQTSSHTERQAVSNLDIFQTVTSLFGINHEIPVEGADLTSKEWKGRPDAALVETYGSYSNLDPDKRAKTIANSRYRYTCFGNSSEMLFDLQTDPDECHNLIKIPKYQKKLSELRKLVIDFTAVQYIPLPTRNKHPFGEH